MIRKALARLLLLLLLPLSGLLVLAPPAFADAHIVAIAPLGFHPSTMYVQVGDTVTWTNMDAVAHDVTVTDGPAPFTSDRVEPGQSWQFVVGTLGEYTYASSKFPRLRATMIVVPAGSSAGAMSMSGMQRAADPEPAVAPQPSSSVNAKLLLAGLVVGIVVLCLFLLGSRVLSGREP